MLPGCLESLQGQVDRIVVVDGAYAQFPYEEPVSTDATREIALCYGAEWIDCPDDEEGYPRAWRTQVEKRNAYLVGEEGDWYLIIDADNRLIGTLPEPMDGMVYVFRSSNRMGQPVWALRLLQHQGRMRYEGSHNGLWSDGQLMNRRFLPADRVVYVDPGMCHYVHLAALRSANRLIAKRRFYERQTADERGYRLAHGI